MALPTHPRKTQHPSPRTRHSQVREAQPRRASCREGFFSRRKRDGEGVASGSARGTALLLFALLASAGCRTAEVTPLRDAFAGIPAPKAAAKPSRYFAVVTSFEDARPHTVRQSGLNAIPVLGLFLQGIGDKHARPEETTSEIWYGNFGEGSLAEELPRLLADQLTAAGAFREVRFVPQLDEDIHDVRRYDYIISGTLRDSTLEAEYWDYGLNAFTIVDASILPHLLGLPFERRSASLTFDIVVKEQASGRIVMQSTEKYPKVSASEGLYYGHKVEGTQPYAGVLARSIREGMPGTVEGVVGAIPRD